MEQRPETTAVFTEIDDATASVCLTGDLDLQAEPNLRRVLSEVHTAGRRAVVVDLAGLGFAGSALPNFLVRLRYASPPGATLSVCDPGPMALRLLELTGVLTAPALSGDLTAPPAGSQAA